MFEEVGETGFPRFDFVARARADDDVMGYDFVNNDADLLDDFGHGTWVAGVIGAATNNAIGIAGVCWDCKIMNLKVLNDTGYCQLVHIARAIEYAANNGADIISMSLGFYYNIKYIREALDFAYDRGCVLVAGAGNDNTSEETYPAAYENVLP